MTGALLKVLFFVAILTYGVFFVLWNQGIIVDLLLWPGPPNAVYANEVPIGLVPLAGVVIGAILMAVAAWGAWASQRAIAVMANAQVERAKEKLRSMAETIKNQRAELEALKAAAAKTGDEVSTLRAKARAELDTDDDEEII